MMVEKSRNLIPALPFCHVTLKAEKPKHFQYLKKLETLGDHIRKRRLDLGMFQTDIAQKIGVIAETVFRWESKESYPSITQIPKIIRFLGYYPFPMAKSLSEELRDSRRRLGLSQTAMARGMGVDPTTLHKWEQGRARPNRHSLEIIKKFVL
jgi:DNA-binding transcriptional regulator YiaG